MHNIMLTKDQLYRLLIPRIGKKNAKRLAFHSKYSINRHYINRDILQSNMWYLTNNLKDIRLLKLFGCPLHPKQEMILINNGQYYVINEQRHN